MKNSASLLMAILLLSGCKQSTVVPAQEEKPEEKPKGISLSDQQISEGKIEFEPAQIRSIQAELKVPGTVATIGEGRALVTPPVNGKVLKLFVAAGEKVKAGQPLALIQSAELAESQSLVADARRAVLAAESEIARSNAEIELARTHVKSAELSLNRQREMSKSGAFSQPSLQSAMKERDEAQAELDSIRADSDSHQKSLERAERLFKQELISKTELEQAQLLVSQDEIKRSRATKRLSIAEATVAREQDISRKGLLNAKEVQAAESEYKTAKLELSREQIRFRSLMSALTSAKRSVADQEARYAALKGSGNAGSGSEVTLCSPIDGLVTERKATIGQAVERAAELFEVENLSTVWVTANVPEKEIAKVTVGLKVDVTLAAFPGRTFKGTVQRLDNHLDSKTRTMPVQCIVQNPQGILREDMFANVILHVGSARRATTVPDKAIDQHSNEASVFVKIGNKIEKKPVKLGRSSEGFTEILSGIKPGNIVVTEGKFIVESESRKDELKGEE